MHLEHQLFHVFERFVINHVAQTFPLVEFYVDFENVYYALREQNQINKTNCNLLSLVEAFLWALRIIYYHPHVIPKYMYLLCLIWKFCLHFNHLFQCLIKIYTQQKNIRSILSVNIIELFKQNPLFHVPASCEFVEKCLASSRCWLQYFSLQVQVDRTELLLIEHDRQRSCYKQYEAHATKATT